MQASAKDKSDKSAESTEKTSADILVERLMEWGVDIIFGLPGDGIDGIMEALRKRQKEICFIQVRHEEAAALMACGYAKFTGRLGVCLATTGPGAIHLLNGLYDAKMDNAPVLAITGQTYHDLIGSSYQQEVDLISLFKDVAGYNQMVMSAGHVHMLADEACRQALSKKQVSHLIFPLDIQDQKIEEDKPSTKKVRGHTTSRYTFPAGVPTDELLQKAADILNSGNKTVIMAGQGALGCRVELELIAEILGAPIVKPLLGKASVPDDSPFTTGGVGLLGTLPSQRVLEECGCLLIVGSNFPYMEYYPKVGQARCVQIDIKPERLGIRYPVELGLSGDAKETLQLLIPLLQQSEDKKFLRHAQEMMVEWNKMLEDRVGPETPLKSQAVARALNNLLKEDAIITSDSGSNTFWTARYLKMKGSQMFNNTGLLATMGAGLPYINAAQLAYPNRQCVAFVGDGGFTMLMCEFLTAVKYNLPVTIVVMKNNTLSMIKIEQMMFLGNPTYGIELQGMDFVKFAESCGGVGFRCSTSDEVETALRQALNSARPAIVEAIVDENEVPLPPTLSEEQAKHVKEAIKKGKAIEKQVGLTMFRNKILDWPP